MNRMQEQFLKKVLNRIWKQQNTRNTRKIIEPKDCLKLPQAVERDVLDSFVRQIKLKSRTRRATIN